MFPGEDGSVGEHLCQYTAHGPHIDAFAVAFTVEHDLGRSVPPCGHILCQEAGVVMVGVCHSGQAEVTDLQHEKTLSSKDKK